MIDWAGARDLGEWNAQWVRIDVWTTNVALHGYYEKRGFRFCRIARCHAEDYPSAALFQKPTSEIDLAVATSFEIDRDSERNWSARTVTQLTHRRLFAGGSAS